SPPAAGGIFLFLFLFLLPCPVLPFPCYWL
ncbi:MAG: hypothetical protein B193_2456, partial [Solidesulfovibrio magneticus str. Maddingley MBC34]